MRGGASIIKYDDRMPHSHITEHLWGSVLEVESTQQYLLSSWVATAGSYASNLDFKTFTSVTQKQGKRAYEVLFPYDREDKDNTVEPETEELIKTFKRWEEYTKKINKN